MNNQLTGKRSISQTGIMLVFSAGLSSTILSCGDIKQPKTADVTELSKLQIANHDSLIKAVLKFAEPYFNTQSVDNIISLKGQPQRISKIEWGENKMHKDSLVTVVYPLLTFNFLQSPNAYSGLQSVFLLDKRITLAGNTTIGRTTRPDLVRLFGFPDSDYNDGNRTMTKSGDTTAYGTRSGIGDTVIFSYHVNVDEYAINFEMTKDTLRRITWVKNMN